jgi:hypothetical protein
MGTIFTTDQSLDINAAAVGTLASPASGTVTAVMKYVAGYAQITFTLDAARIAVTDAAGSGSYGSLKLMDMAPGSWHFLSSRVDFTAYSPDGTGVPNDAVFDIGVGTGAISAAADGVLTGDATYDNVAAKVDQTLSGGTVTGTALDAANAVVDGTGTDLDLNLNWSGTGATIDGDGTIDVTGTITVNAVWLGDD